MEVLTEMIYVSHIYMRRNKKKNKSELPQDSLTADNRLILEEFLRELHSKHQESLSPYKYDIFRVGGAYENLSLDDVFEDSDADIVLALGGDFVSDNFSVECGSESFHNRFVRLKGKKPMNHLDSEGFLDAHALRHGIFWTLVNHIDKMRTANPDTKFFCRMGETALTVQLIKYYEEPYKRVSMSIDLVPQIPVYKWSLCPYLLPVHKMPQWLRDIITKREEKGLPCAFLSFNAPLHTLEYTSDRFFSVSFALIEKDFVLSDLNIRDMVLILKHVAKECGWKKKFHFKSFYAKRLVMKYWGILREIKDTEERYQRLFQCLAEEVNTKGIDAVFIENDTIVEYSSDTANEFYSSILDLEPKVHSCNDQEGISIEYSKGEILLVFHFDDDCKWDDL